MTEEKKPDPTAAIEKRQLEVAELTPSEQKAETLLALMNKDVGLLKQEEKAMYLATMARSLGLNPMLKPFDLIPNDKGSLIVYANAGCADQLRELRKLQSVPLYAGPACTVYMDENNRLVVDRTSIIDKDTYMVVVKVTEKTADGERVTYDVGCTSIAEAKGKGMQNALMRTWTKADRRATLGHCGVGFPDASEVDSIPQPRQDWRGDTPRMVAPPPPRALSEAPLPQVDTSTTSSQPVVVPEVVIAPLAQPLRAAQPPAAPRRPVPPPIPKKN